MRILIVDTCYEAFLASHYAASPGLERASYGEQWRALMDTFFGTADAYSHNLRALGHEAHEVIANCIPLQRAWTSEHKPRWRRHHLDSVVLRQAEWFEPDVVYVQNLSSLTDDVLDRLATRATLVGQLGTEPPPLERLRRYHLLLTPIPHFVERLRDRGLRSEYFRIGFDERVLERLEGSRPERYGATFVGALAGEQWRRTGPLLERAARRVRIDVWGYGAWPLPGCYHGEAWGLAMYRVHRESKLALNRHGDVAGDYAVNMRLYETTGVGTMLLTDAKVNLAELFEPGREVETYTDEDELVEKVAFYLEHEEQRRAIAAAGQARTLREHTYARRMEELAALLG
jgi:spore maturation protein CgeB